MKTDVHAVDILGCAMQCKGGDARSVHHTDVHLLGQAVLALLDCWMQGQGSMSWYLLVHAGVDVDLLVLVLASADVDTLVLDVDEA